MVWPAHKRPSWEKFWLYFTNLTTIFNCKAKQRPYKLIKDHLEGSLILSSSSCCCWLWSDVGHWHKIDNLFPFLFFTFICLFPFLFYVPFIFMFLLLFYFPFLFSFFDSGVMLEIGTKLAISLFPPVIIFQISLLSSSSSTWSLSMPTLSFLTICWWNLNKYIWPFKQIYLAFFN